MINDLWTKIDELCDLNEARLKDMRGAGIVAAEAGAEYRKMLTIAILEERAKGTAVTLIKDIVRGREDIAEVKLRHDVAQSDYEAFAEEINANKLRIRVLSEQLKREWAQTGEQ